MNLVSTNFGKNSCLIWLKFSNGALLPMKSDDFVKLGLHKSVEISDELYQQIQKLSLCFMLSEYALRQIAISPKTEQILIPKLQTHCHKLTDKFGYPVSFFPEIIEEVIQKLSQQNLLDSSRYKDYFIKRHPKMSQFQIRYSLNRLGITTPLDSPSSDIEKIKNLISKKYKNLNYSDYRDKIKLFAALTRRGFALNDIKTVIDDKG